jgi:DNA polymerase-3 subunit beta
MKAVCNRDSLLAGLSVVSGVVPSRSPKPQLRNVKLIVRREEGSTLLATDLEIGIRYRVLGIKSDEPGEVILPTQRFQAILRTSTDEELYLEADSDMLQVRGQHSQFQLPGDDPDTFPDIAEFTASDYYVMKASELQRLVRRTVFATDFESTRYALGGVLFEIGEGRLTLVSTDGRRLASASGVIESEGMPKPFDGKPVVPVKALKQLERSITDDEAPVRLSFQGTSAILFQTDSAVLYSRLIEGRFPRYQDVIPVHSETKIDLQVGPLLAAVEQASIVTNEESRGVDFEFGEGVLKLSIQVADVGAANIDLAIPYEGKPIVVRFDPKYLSDALKVLEPDRTITVELIDSRSAVVFKTTDHYTYVVMPLSRV